MTYSTYIKWHIRHKSSGIFDTSNGIFGVYQKGYLTYIK